MSKESAERHTKAAETHRKRTNANGQGAPCAKALQGNGVKPPPKSTPARGRSAKAPGEDIHSLEPVRSIAGLTIADFLYDR